MLREGGPVGVMLVEHDQGRGFVRAMEAALERYREGEKLAGATLAVHARAYVELLRDHIAKEDSVLFPLTDRLLTETDVKELSRKFEQVETEVVPEGAERKYRALVGRLEQEMGISGPRANG